MNNQDANEQEMEEIQDIRTVSRAARENRPDVMRLLIKSGKPVRANDNYGWTALHHAAFLGHVECSRILLGEETCEIDDRAFDGSTPLMVACANLPTSKSGIKVLCEYKADQGSVRQSRLHSQFVSQ